MSLEDFGQRVDLDGERDDRELSPAHRRQLGEIVTLLRRLRDRGDPGFAVLFAGAGGTGKTLAAEVIASRAGVDLYRIDLSKIVSKYIGETEKNLDRVFDAAEAGGPVLLFEEADALFGKRSEVQDSDDRAANVAISYLLRRLESYHGLGILATALMDRIEPRLLGRFRFILDFPSSGR